MNDAQDPEGAAPRRVPPGVPEGVLVWARHEASPALEADVRSRLAPGCAPVLDYFQGLMASRPFQRTIMLNELEHAQLGAPSAAVMQVPTGGGKTLPMLAGALLAPAAPFYRGGGHCIRPRALVLKPDVSIRNQSMRDLVAHVAALHERDPAGPALNVVCVVRPERGQQLQPWEVSSLVDDHGHVMPQVQAADVVVANFHRFVDDNVCDTAGIGRGIPRGFFSKVILDEGHHLGAETYVKVVKYFCGGEGRHDNAHLTLYSATPERQDGEHNLEFLPLEWLFFMSKEYAWRNNYIKRFVFVEPYCESMLLQREPLGQFQTVTITRGDDDEQKNILELRKQRWFQKLAATSTDIQRDTIITMLRILTHQRKGTGTRHFAVLLMPSIAAASAVLPLIRQIHWPLGQDKALAAGGLRDVAMAKVLVGNMAELHPGLSAGDAAQMKKDIITQASHGLIDLLILVGMLREGWSNWLVSVIGFCSAIPSMMMAEQIAGRGARRMYLPANADHPAHVAMGASELRQQFGLPGAVTQQDIDAHDQTCYVVAPEAFNMLPVLSQAGIVSGAEGMHISVASGRAPQGMRGGGGEGEGGPPEPRNPPAVPTLLVKAESGISVQMFGLAGADVTQGDADMVDAHGGGVAADINQQIGMIDGVVGGGVAGVGAAGPPGGMMAQMAQMMQLMQQMHEGQQQLQQNLQQQQQP